MHCVPIIYTILSCGCNLFSLGHDHSRSFLLARLASMMYETTNWNKLTSVKFAEGSNGECGAMKKIK